MTSSVAQPEPDVSIVIPLYKRVDLIEQQLAEFVLDPDLSRQTSSTCSTRPRTRTSCCSCVAAVPDLRGAVPVAILERNAGFAGANNAGAPIARGRLLLLMNSDVLPDRPGWLERDGRASTTRRHDIGALGPKLLYEDDSIQHAGMRFHRPQGTSVWHDDHYFRGLHRGFPPPTWPAPCRCCQAPA